MLPVFTVAKVAARLLLQAVLQGQEYRGLGPLPEEDTYILYFGPKDFLLIQKVISTAPSPAAFSEDESSNLKRHLLGWRKVPENLSPGIPQVR